MLLTLALLPLARAANLVVPAQYATIQAAVEAADDGDTVLVSGGPYAESVVVEGKSLALVGAGAVVTIAGETALQLIEADNTTVTGFVLSGSVHGARVRDADGVVFTDVTFTGAADADVDGGGLWVDDAEVTAAQCTITGNLAGTGGGVLLDGGALVLDGCTVTGNVADDAGGGIAVLDGDLTVRDSEISGNVADDGAGLWFDAFGDAMVLSATTVRANSAAASGGGIVLEDGLAIWTDVTIDANVAGERAPAVWLRGGELGSTATAVRNHTGAAAVDIEGADTAWIGAGDVFEANVGDAGGAALVADGALLWLTDATFVDDQATDGGCLRQRDDAEVVLTGGSFTRCTADARGGAIAQDGPGLLWIEGVNFDSCAAGTDGGSVWAVGPGALTWLDSDTVGATAGGAGAGGFWADKEAFLWGGTWDGGDAVLRGGALAVQGGTLTVGDAAFVCNQTDGDGGGVSAVDVSGSVVTTVFSDNDAAGLGGGLAWRVNQRVDADLTALNLTFTGNSAPSGAGAWVEDPAFAWVNNLMAFQDGDGLATGGGSGLVWPGLFVYTNNLWWDNPAGDVGGDLLLQALPLGFAPVQADPHLGWSDNGDCSDDTWLLDPLFPSPAIDAGFGTDGVDPYNPADIGAAGGLFLDLELLTDGDGDGVTAQYDCDDADATVYPGAGELCDGIDQDCDGDLDEEPTDGIAAFVDADGDGHGTDPLTVCALEPGVAATGGDCDDADAAVHPGAAEVCDDADQDCDGAIDDGLPTTPRWTDGDGDGFGAGPPLPEDCHPAPAGTAPVDGDCDDGDAAVYPGATDLPNDGQDADCDGGDGPAPDPNDPADPVAETPWVWGGGGGCGCATTRAGGLSWLGAAAAAFVARRRQLTGPRRHPVTAA
jgi:hypothetical protein